MKVVLSDISLAPDCHPHHFALRLRHMRVMASQVTGHLLCIPQLMQADIHYNDVIMNA